MAAICIWLLYGAGAFCLDPHQRFIIQSDVKRSWEKWARRNNASPEDYLANLDPVPATLKKEHPKLYNKVFPECHPEFCRLDLMVLSSIDNMVQCRAASLHPSLHPSLHRRHLWRHLWREAHLEICTHEVRSACAICSKLLDRRGRQHRQ